MLFRSAIGAVPSDSDTLIIRTRQWVSDHDMDAVMLLTIDPESSVPTVILVAQSFHTAQMIDEHAVGKILNLFHGNGFAAIAD